MILFLSMKCHSYILSLIFKKLFFRLIFKTILFFFHVLMLYIRILQLKWNIEYSTVNLWMSIDVLCARCRNQNALLFIEAKIMPLFLSTCWMLNRKSNMANYSNGEGYFIHNTGKWFETYLTKINVNKTWPILFYIIKHCELFLFRITRQLTMLNLVWA